MMALNIARGLVNPSIIRIAGVRSASNNAPQGDSASSSSSRSQQPSPSSPPSSSSPPSQSSSSSSSRSSKRISSKSSVKMDTYRPSNSQKNRPKRTDADLSQIIWLGKNEGRKSKMSGGEREKLSTPSKVSGSENVEKSSGFGRSDFDLSKGSLDYRSKDAMSKSNRWYLDTYRSSENSDKPKPKRTGLSQIAWLRRNEDEQRRTVSPSEKEKRTYKMPSTPSKFSGLEDIEKFSGFERSDLSKKTQELGRKDGKIDASVDKTRDKTVSTLSDGSPNPAFFPPTLNGLESWYLKHRNSKLNNQTPTVYTTEESFNGDYKRFLAGRLAKEEDSEVLQRADSQLSQNPSIIPEHREAVISQLRKLSVAK